MMKKTFVCFTQNKKASIDFKISIYNFHVKLNWNLQEKIIEKEYKSYKISFA